MRQTIESIDVVSDGIVVQFRDGITCYYPAAFLLDHANIGSNQVLVDHDPTPAVQWDADAFEAVSQASTGQTKSRMIC